MTQRSTTFSNRVWAALVGLGVLVTASAAVGQEVRYSYVDIGTLGGPSSQALAMNDEGVVVGWADRSARVEDFHAFLWDGSMRDLGSLGGWSEARGINNAGMVVGVSMTPEGEEHAFIYFGDQMRDLNSMLGVQVPGFEEPEGGEACMAPLQVLFEANAISDSGMIVACGFAYADEAPHGYLLVPEFPVGSLRQRFTVMDLGTLPGATDCVPYAVNDWGDVVGVSGGRAFLWSAFGMAELAPDAQASEARGVSGTGDVVGWSLGRLGRRAELWSMLPVELYTPMGWESKAYDINSEGVAVGWISDVVMPPALPPQGAVWIDGHPVQLNGVTDIPTLPDLAPWVWIEHAEAIDEDGRIAGYGRLESGAIRAFVLVPYPPED